MKSKFFLVLVSFFTFQAFAEESPIGLACNFVYSESLLRFACSLKAKSELESGKSEVEVVADVCDEVADIPENAHLFQACFQQALPEAPVPPGYPTAKAAICAQFGASQARYGKVLETWQCTHKEADRIGGITRTDHCFVQWQRVEGKKAEGRISRNYKTTYVPLKGRAFSYWNNTFDYDVDSGKMITDHTMTVSGKISKLNTKTLQLEERFRIDSFSVHVTNYKIDKIEKSLKLKSCYANLAGCKDPSTKKMLCQRVD